MFARRGHNGDTIMWRSLAQRSTSALMGHSVRRCAVAGATEVSILGHAYGDEMNVLYSKLAMITKHLWKVERAGRKADRKADRTADAPVAILDHNALLAAYMKKWERNENKKDDEAKTKERKKKQTRKRGKYSRRESRRRLRLLPSPHLPSAATEFIAELEAVTDKQLEEILRNLKMFNSSEGAEKTLDEIVPRRQGKQWPGTGPSTGCSAS